MELATRNGAILADEDLVSMLFPLGSTLAEELKATILKKSLPPLLDRYEEACVQTKTSMFVVTIANNQIYFNILAPNETLKDILRQTTTVLDISDLMFRGLVLTPLCKAINRQDNLIELNFSGNFMKSDCFQLLCASLPSLVNLVTLNLSLNDLTAESMKFFSEAFTNSEKTILENLVSLNLSYNPFYDDAFCHLAVITRYLRLKELDLTSVNLTAHVLDNFHTRNVEFYLGSVESLKIGYNKLDKTGILKFVSWLNPKSIQQLDVSNNCVTEEGLVREMFDYLKKKGDGDLFFKKIGLANCRVADSDVFALLRYAMNKKTCYLINRIFFSVFSSCTVNLSNNQQLTSISLRRLLLHQPPLKHLDIYGCGDICKYLDANAVQTWRLPEGCLKSFTISFNRDGEEKCLQTLETIWRERHKSKAGLIMEARVVKFFIL